ncbi:hypothetical protein ACN28S_54060 [Cystobacter fuscus]
MLEALMTWGLPDSMSSRTTLTGSSGPPPTKYAVAKPPRTWQMSV